LPLLKFQPSYLPTVFQLPKLSHVNEEEKLSFLSVHEDVSVGD